MKLTINYLPIVRTRDILTIAFTAAKPIIALEQECNCLLRLPAVSHLVLGDLLGELGQYHAVAGAHDQLWAFWRHNELRLPVWFKFARNVALVMTSLASVERIFSLYEGRFNEQQHAAHEDYNCLCICVI